MRVRVSLISPLLVLVLWGCGDSGDSGGKQSKISAAAYPAVEEFVTSDFGPDEYRPICDKLSAVSRKDEVAAAAEHACSTLVSLTSELEPFKAEIDPCRDADCIADKMEPVLTKFLAGLLQTSRTYKRELKDTLESGACLKALSPPEADLKAIDRSRKQIPDAIARFRGGDRNALRTIFDVDFADGQDLKPCKP